MNGTVLAMNVESDDTTGEYELGRYGGLAAAEHDECGGTAFFPLAPVHNALFYFFIPEISCE